LEGHEFETPELELKEFLRKIFEPDWKWSEQYEPDSAESSESSDECEFKISIENNEKLLI
jgi:voltage-dependent calcium channel alpha-2/delta-4